MILIVLLPTILIILALIAVKDIIAGVQQGRDELRREEQEERDRQERRKQHKEVIAALDKNEQKKSRYCAQCGAALSENAKFCTECGEKIDT